MSSKSILAVTAFLVILAGAAFFVGRGGFDTEALEQPQRSLRGTQQEQALRGGYIAAEGQARSHASPEEEVATGNTVQLLLRCMHTGALIPEAEVIEESVSSPGNIRRAGGGRWEVTNWAPGQVLLARAEGFAIREIGYQAMRLLPIDEFSQARVVDLSRLGMLRVRVEDMSGAPIQGAYVRVAPWDGAIQSEVYPLPRDWPEFQVPGFYRDDSTGRAIRAGTNEAGELDVGFMPVGLQLIVYASGRVTDTRALAVVDPETGLGSATLRGDTTFRVEGRVIQEDGAPAAGLMVRLLAPPWLSMHPERRTRNEGQYMFDGVPAGYYRIRETLTGASVELLVGGAPLLHVDDIVIPVLGTLDCTLTVELESSSRDWSGSPFNGLSVHGIMIAGERVTAQPSPEGHFQLRAPRGQITLVVSESSTGRSILRVPASIPSGPCAIALDQYLAGLRFQLRKNGGPRAVDVVLVDISLAEEGILPMFHGRGRPQPRRMQVDGEGRGILTGLRAGMYAMGIRDGPVGAWIPRLELSPGMLDLGELELGVASIRATIVSAGGAPVGGGEWIVRDLFRQQFGGISDVGGKLLLEALLPGPALLLPRERGAAEGSGAVGVLLDSGVEASLVLRLPDTGAIRGRVTARGTLLEGIRVRVQDAVAVGAVLTDASGRYELDPVLHGEHQLIFSEAPGRTERGTTEYRMVHVEAGEEVTLDVDLPAPTGTELRFQDRDGWVHDVEYVVVIEGGGKSARHIVPSGHGVLVWPGADPVSLHGRVLCVRRRTKGYSTGQFQQALFFGTTILREEAESVVIGLADGRLEVEVAEPAQWNQLPQVRVLAVAEIALDLVARTTTAPILMREIVDPSRVVFLGLPVGAEVELAAEDSDGRRVTSRYTFRADNRLLWGAEGLQHGNPHPVSEK